MKKTERSNLIEIEYDELLRSTNAAHLLLIEGDKYWIPKSQIDYLDENKMTFEIPQWLAKEKGLN